MSASALELPSASVSDFVLWQAAIEQRQPGCAVAEIDEALLGVGVYRRFDPLGPGWLARLRLLASGAARDAEGVFGVCVLGDERHWEKHAKAVVARGVLNGGADLHAAGASGQRDV